VDETPSVNIDSGVGTARPPRVPGNAIALTVAVAAISTSGPLVVAITAPALAIAFWRCALGAGATGLWVSLRQRAELRGLNRREQRVTVLAGLLLAVHFATWIPSLRFTSVASSTALVATQPVWAALLARLRGKTVPGRVWLGIGVSLFGVLVLTGIDASIDRSVLFGDLLALAGAVFAAAYVTAGESARATVSTSVYTLTAYATSAIVLLVLCVVGNQALVGFSVRDWVLIALLTAGAQLLGHTLINRTLRTTSATVTSLAILFEMPGSIIIAAIFVGQRPPASVIPAVALLFVGLMIVISSSGMRTPTESPPI